MQSTGVDTSLMAKGIELMVYGMATVMVFLTLLVVVTTLMSLCVKHFLPNAKILAKPRAKSVDARLLAVIKAAIEQHRKQG